MQIGTWRKGFFTSVMLLIALITAALLVRVSGDNGGDTGSSSPTSTTATTTTTTTMKPDNSASLEPELREVLTLRSTTVDCVKIVEEAGGVIVGLSDGSSVYLVNDDSLLPVGEGARLWADALSTPVKADDPKAALDEAILAICQGPLYGSTWMHLFAHLEVGGVKVVDLNPWLIPAKVEAAKINDVAMSYVKEYFGGDVFEYVVSPDYILKAQYVAELLTRFRLVGFSTERSVLNYHLAGGGLVVGTFPEVELNSTQENLPALVLELNSKTGQCLSRIGLNIGDKRPEIFPCSSPPPTKKKPPRVVKKVPPTTVPTVVTTTTTTTTVPPTTVPVSPPTTVGRKGTPATTTPPPPVTATTLACAYGYTRNLATGQCVQNTQTGGDSGVGAPPPATTVAPTPTVAPPGSSPSTSQPPTPGTTIVGP